MNQIFKCCTAPHLPAVLLTALVLVTNTLTFAAPGAHGPNGEHLDGPTAMGIASALPRVEAKSESFELVATLHAGELSVLIDRFETNEPVLNAVLEVESGGLKSKASFNADQGDYAIDDSKFLALLRRPGEHALLFTLTAGKDSDLLDGTLVTAARGAAPAANDHGHANARDDHGHGHGYEHERERAIWLVAGAAALGLIGGIVWWRRRRGNAAQLQGVR